MYERGIQKKVLGCITDTLYTLRGSINVFAEWDPCNLPPTRFHCQRFYHLKTTIQETELLAQGTLKDTAKPWSWVWPRTCFGHHHAISPLGNQGPWWHPQDSCLEALWTLASCRLVEWALSAHLHHQTSDLVQLSQYIIRNGNARWTQGRSSFGQCGTFYKTD